MKRIAAFIILAFFVFLNSGMFVCAVHCSVARMVAKPQMQMACSGPCKKRCTGDKSGDCNKKHGNFTIKENIQPGYSIRMHTPLLTLNYEPFTSPYTPVVTYHKLNMLSQTGKAPPGSGKLTIIKIHSLLI